MQSSQINGNACQRLAWAPINRLCMLYAMSCNTFPNGPGNLCLPIQTQNGSAGKGWCNQSRRSCESGPTARHTHLIFCLQRGVLSIYEQMSSLDGEHQVYDWTLLMLLLILFKQTCRSFHAASSMSSTYSWDAWHSRTQCLFSVVIA